MFTLAILATLALSGALAQQCVDLDNACPSWGRHCALQVQHFPFTRSDHFYFLAKCLQTFLLFCIKTIVVNILSSSGGQTQMSCYMWNLPQGCRGLWGSVRRLRCRLLDQPLPHLHPGTFLHKRVLILRFFKDLQARILSTIIPPSESNLSKSFITPLQVQHDCPRSCGTCPPAPEPVQYVCKDTIKECDRYSCILVDFFWWEIQLSDQTFKSI